MERAEYKTTNGGSRRATPDAPECIGHPKRCTGHGRRTPDGGSARERVPTAPQVRKRVETSATPDAPERIGHPRRCTGHGRRTPDGGSARERVPTAPHVAKTGRDVQRRTRRSASAIQGAAQDMAVGRRTAAPRGSASLPTAPHVQKRVETCNAGRAGAHRPSKALHRTRPSDA